MTEQFVEYSVARPWGEVPIARELEEEEREFEACVVSHPDAGGPCGWGAVYEVYGLMFCAPHGLEVNYAALSELYDQANVALEQVHNDRAVSLHPELDVAFRALRGTFNGQVGRFEDSYGALAARAFPLLEGEAWIEPETRRWQPEEGGPTPADQWHEETWAILRFMREARSALLPETVEHLEYLRERTAAQAAYANAVQERKVAELLASRDA